MATQSSTPVERIAVVGNYVPRRCGIATFTTDLCEALAARYPKTTCVALAVNDRSEGYAYPDRVRFELRQDDLNTYRSAADFLNINGMGLVCLQHEYGIFGGPAGSHVLALLRELRTPIVTTLHTVLQEPSQDQRAVLKEVCDLSDRVVVMSERGVGFLTDVYDVPEDKINLIPHGIPDVPFVDPNFYKDKFGVEGRRVILTFGLLSPNKGVEYVIEAMPAILRRYPDTVYIVVGATHPHIQRDQGELYRLSLERLAQERGVAENLLFFNRFVELDELIEFIGCADFCITPYLNPKQITSGPLSIAVGSGKAVVSTPFWHAEELLADGRGVLVPFRDSDAIADAVLGLLERSAERHAMRKRAYNVGRKMIWPVVAGRYMESFLAAHRQRGRRPRAMLAARTVAQRPGELPLLRLDHLRRLTDDTGLLQHARFNIPNYREGYTTDDNARALVLTALLRRLGKNHAQSTANLATRYLAFLCHAFDPATRRFRNFMGYDRNWLERFGSEDSHGRAIMGLGAAVARFDDPGLHGLASQLFESALPPARSFTSPRSCAFCLLGLGDYLARFPGDSLARHIRLTLAEQLLDLHRSSSSPDWPWFEDRLTYCNATLPHALLVAGRAMRRDDMIDAALEALQWLVDVQRPDGGNLVPIGTNGFYQRGGERARFDQQPVEAHATVSACLEAHRATGEPAWKDQARQAFDWFIGENDLGVPPYDPGSGGCRDGLHPDRPNENQGAESTLAFLLSLVEMRLAESLLQPDETDESEPCPLVKTIESRSSIATPGIPS